jgi:PQQ-dependent catabolism-associated CXXCW motif protein
VSALAALPAAAQRGMPLFADEDRDWGVPPARSLRLADYHAPTPAEIPGARVIRTVELQELLERERRVVLVDVLGEPAHPTLPGAAWLRNAGLGDFFGNDIDRLEAALAKLTEGDRRRPLVFFCLSAECWLSYNAALRAVAFGYREVIWYRGGVEAWRAAGYPMSRSVPYPW